MGNFRYVIYGLCTLTVALVYALRLAFHSTIICQHNTTDTDHYLSNANLRGWSFASVSIGLVLGLIPLSAIHSLGTRKILLIYVFAGCISAFLYPASDKMGFWPSFIIRTIQGMPGAIILWAVNAVSIEWAPKNEVGLAIAVLSSVYQLSPMIAMVTAGEMCVGWGWEYTYYVLGICTIILMFLFIFLYEDDVHNSRFVNEKEMELITEGKEKMKTENPAVPYKELFSDPQVWIAWYMYFSFFTGMYIFLQYGPTYINMVLRYDVRSTGYAGALPHLISLVLKFFYGRMLDSFCGLAPKTRLRFLFGLVEVLSAICLIVLIFTDIPEVGLFVYVAFNSINSLAIIVIMKHIQLISRQHAHFLANGNTFIVAVCIFCIPVAVNLVVPDNSASQWATLFAGISAQLVSSVLIYSLFAKITPSKWTELHLLDSK